MNERTSFPQDRLRRRWWLRLAVFALAAGAFCAGVAVYRNHQDRRIVAISVARARHLVRSDTWRGYREAADLLGLRAAAIDPTAAGSLRGFALAMLSLDYRDDGARGAARAAPGDGRELSPDGRLAAAALALRDARVGTAVEALSGAGDGPLVRVLRARGALIAGNAPAAAEEIRAALALDARFPAALALRGDLLRRAGRAAEAREAYVAALKQSQDELEAGSGSSPSPAPAPPHARAVFGLAKLALSRDIPAPEAVAALGRLVDDVDTAGVERARGAMYLSALQARLGDRAGAAATLASAPAGEDLRAWLERTSRELEVARGRYRVPAAVPAALVSASDDDPYVPPPPPPPKVTPPPKRQRPWGFKVHPGARPSKAGAKASKPPRKKALDPAPQHRQ